MIKVSRRREVIALVNMIEAGASMKKVAEVLAAYLAENRQLKNAELYLRDIRSELERRFGLVSANVSSARELNDELEKQICGFIKKTTNAKEIEILKSVDKNLIGGVIISTTEAELDNSVRTRLQKLRSV